MIEFLVSGVFAAGKLVAILAMLAVAALAGIAMWFIFFKWMHLVWKGAAGKFKRGFHDAPIAHGVAAVIAIAATGAFVVFGNSWAAPKTADTIKSMFNLQATGRIRWINADRKYRCADETGQITTAVSFDDDEFAAYLAALDNPQQWRGRPVFHNAPGAAQYQFLDGALAWRDLPEPGMIGDQQSVWKIAGHGVRRGRYLCYFVEKTSAGAASYLVQACDWANLDYTPSKGANIQGVVDFESKKLYVAMNYDDRAIFCGDPPPEWLQKLRAAPQANGLDALRPGVPKL